MAEVPPLREGAAPPPPLRPAALVAYVEDMLLQLAELASQAGETALAASLALTAIQAGATLETLRRETA